MPEKRFWIVSKVAEPEALGDAYASSLEQLPGEEVDLTPNTDGVTIKSRSMTPEQAEMVAARAHIASVSEDRRVQAFGTDFDEGARLYCQIVQANKSGADGEAQTIAVLDTGVRDETVRNAPLKVRAMRSFVDGQAVEDLNGHGDFCCVAACPPAANLLVGKVLSNEGSGWDSWIIAGIDWAIANGADCISMSLGSDSTDTRAYDPILRRCQELGPIVFAAAGNAGNDRPVGSPGRSPFCFAVAAMDVRNDSVARFSCTGPEVDFAGPGVGVFYRGKWWNGTSMATPLVACSFLTILGEVKPGTRQERAAIAMKAMSATCRNLPAPPEYDGLGVPQVVAATGKIAPEPTPAPPKPPDQPAPKPEPPKPTRPTIRRSKVDNLSEEEMLNADLDVTGRGERKLARLKGYGA